MKKQGNTVLYQFGKMMEDEEKNFLLECCAFDLYRIEYCARFGKRIGVTWKDLITGY